MAQDNRNYHNHGTDQSYNNYGKDNRYNSQHSHNHNNQRILNNQQPTIVNRVYVNSDNNVLGNFVIAHVKRAEPTLRANAKIVTMLQLVEPYCDANIFKTSKASIARASTFDNKILTVQNTFYSASRFLRLAEMNKHIFKPFKVKKKEIKKMTDDELNKLAINFMRRSNVQTEELGDEKDVIMSNDQEEEIEFDANHNCNVFDHGAYMIVEDGEFILVKNFYEPFIRKMRKQSILKTFGIAAYLLTKLLMRDTISLVDVGQLCGDFTLEKFEKLMSKYVDIDLWIEITDIDIDQIEEVSSVFLGVVFEDQSQKLQSQRFMQL